MIRTIDDLSNAAAQYNADLDARRYHIYVCGGAGCVSSGCKDVKNAVTEAVKEYGLENSVKIIETGCIGTCAVGPVMLIEPDDVFYTKLDPAKAHEVIKAHLTQGRVIEEYTFFDRSLGKYVPKMSDIGFFARQTKIVLRNCGSMEYSDINAYIARDGYKAAYKVFTSMSQQDTVDEVKASGLMGRGGAGFPTGLKWEAGMKQQSDEKYYVCNADEGDPGAFMDRSVIEGDPHSVIEGMMIGGFAIGAHQGYVYIRAEYPLAIERLEGALSQARDQGLLGDDIFGTGYKFDIEIRIGAGAFVCGEETALMNSIEGRRGEPNQKPPFPFQSGLFHKPTIINNVETIANIPAIIHNGASWYAQWGTEKAKGTKVFALAGDIVNTGIAEVPIGTPLGDILFDIGGGIPDGKKFKAVQLGGPSGGCITAENLNTPVDYDSIKALGAIMGSGGFIVMNEDTCMVDTARYFMDFIKDESCGKCVACRIGTHRMLEILERITKGEGQQGDIEKLIELGDVIKDTAMCGLGQTAPNPVLSAIANFREEFEEHIKYKKCKAGVCADLFIAPCENTCPANVNVPGYTSLIAEDRFIDAYNLIRQENPLPAVCGRICTHPCEKKCRRGTLDDPIAICELKRFAADYAFKNEAKFKQDVVFPKNGKKIAIIGAGASGITCGHYLVRLGYDVDIFESESVPGGVLAYGIPEYRMPTDILLHEIGLIEQEGVNIHLNTTVGKEVTFDSLKTDYDAVFVATGTQMPQKVNVKGEDLAGVVHGIDFLKRVKLGHDTSIGENAVIIGGGNTAIDSARTAVRCGAKNVTVIYRRDANSMPAYKEEIEEAVSEGVVIKTLLAPVQFIDDGTGHVKSIECKIMKLAEFDNSGRRRSADAELEHVFIDADTVIPAVSQHADLPFIRVEDIGRTPWGTFTVDRDTMMTTIDGVFAGGDIVNGPDTVIQAIADGKKAAISIDKYLGGKGILNKGAAIEFEPWEDDDEVQELKRYPIDMLPACDRCGNFDEVELGYHKLTAMAESMRCLHCERR